jgi:hypothetical protein
MSVRSTTVILPHGPSSAARAAATAASTSALPGFVHHADDAVVERRALLELLAGGDELAINEIQDLFHAVLCGCLFSGQADGR